MLRTVLLGTWIVVAVAATAAGSGYYLTPYAERPFSEAHELFSATGVIGQGYGVIGAGMIAVGVALYSTRKRWSALSRFGRLEHWLDVHIFLCTLGAFLVVLHTTFRVGGLVSISFWSMIVVTISGIFGRYVYFWIPRTIEGHARSLASLREERERIARRIEASTGDPTITANAPWDAERDPAEVSGQPPLGAGAALLHTVRHRFRRGSERRRLHRRLRAHGIGPAERERLGALLRTQDRLQEQLVVLPAFQRVLRYWHAIHVPLTTLMFAVLGVHVVVAIAFGYTWIF